MSKSYRMYKIFMTTMVVIIAGLLLATGIIAIQKQMKLKTSFEYIPGVDVEIYVKNVDNSSERLIFSNYEKGASGIYVDTKYCLLSATTLTMNSDFAKDYGNNFSIVINNYSGFAIDSRITSTSTAKVGETSINAVEPEITPFFSVIGSEAKQEFTVTCEPVIPQESVFKIALAENIPMITLNLNGGEFNDSANEILLNGDYSSLPSIISQVPMKTGYTFGGWYSEAIDPLNIANEQTQYYSYSFLSDNPELTRVKTQELTEDVSLYARWLPFTIKTYTSGAWEGYKYINFENHEEKGTTFVDANSNKIPMNWVIIGAGENVNSALSGVPADKLPVGAYGGTLNSVTGTNADNLENNEVLLFSQYSLTVQEYSTAGIYVYCGWSGSSLRGYLNDDGDENFMALSGLSSYLNYIKSDNTIKTAWGGETDEAENQSLFVLAAKGYSNSNFYENTYLGETRINNLRYTDFIGADDNRWWLRNVYNCGSGNGYCGHTINDDGNNGGHNGNSLSEVHGVRPCFIMNLA